jgi:hypothetical protein
MPKPNLPGLVLIIQVCGTIESHQNKRYSGSHNFLSSEWLAIQNELTVVNPNMSVSCVNDCEET